MNILTTKIETLSYQPSYWHSHWYWLAVAWFGFSFIAVLINKKLNSSILLKIIRFVLYVLIYTITFSLLAATIIRLTPIFDSFDKWIFWRRSHILIQLLLDFVLLFHVLTGITSVFSRDSNPLGNLYRLVVIFCLLIISRYYLALIFTIVAIVQWYVLRTPSSRKIGIHQA